MASFVEPRGSGDSDRDHRISKHHALPCLDLPSDTAMAPDPYRHAGQEKIVLDSPGTRAHRRSGAEYGDCIPYPCLGDQVTILAVSHQPAIKDAADRAYRIEDGMVYQRPTKIGPLLPTQTPTKISANGLTKMKETGRFSSYQTLVWGRPPMNTVLHK
jgi:hypothetical protein